MTKLERAVDDALRGKERKDIEVDSHRFHIKPIQVKRSNGRIEATGQLSHDIRFRPDDQVRYHVVKENGTVSEAEVTGIDRGGLSSLVKKLDEDIASTIAKGGDLLDGDWEGAARQIVAVVAARLR
ncbi:MAG TPA: hypothetical protein VK002_12795 [Rubricoccaceae bacterium]|nr:hypothetical protein [Rubricoccaceae bacterium]